MGAAVFEHFCITQLKAQGPSRTCNESKEEEEEDSRGEDALRGNRPRVVYHQVYLSIRRKAAHGQHRPNPADGSVESFHENSNFKRTVSRLKVFRGTNKTLLRRQRTPSPNTFGVSPG